MYICITVQSSYEMQPRKALPHYDWNKMKLRYHYPERSRHSLAVADNMMHRARCSDSNLLPYNTSYVLASSNHAAMRHVNSACHMPEFQRLPLHLQRPRSTTPTTNFKGNNAHLYSGRESGNVELPIARSSQNTLCEFESCLLPGGSTGYSANFVGCGTGLDTLYETDSTGNNLPAPTTVKCLDHKTSEISSHESRNIDSNLSHTPPPSGSPSSSGSFDNNVPISQGLISMQETRQIIDDIESLLV